MTTIAPTDRGRAAAAAKILLVPAKLPFGELRITTPIFSQYLGPADNTIHTLVLTDVQGGNAMNPLAMELTDLD
jgi:hypothetical protein